jgi:hypothetical protein
VPGRTGALVQRLARSAHKALTSGEPARRLPPTLEEVNAAVQREGLYLSVFFVDGTFEHVCYSLNTTVAEAAAQLAHSIGLRSTESFALFAGSTDAMLTGGHEGPGLFEVAPDSCVGDVLLGVCSPHAGGAGAAAADGRHLPTVPEDGEYACGHGASSSGSDGDGGGQGSWNDGRGAGIRLLFKKRLFREADAESSDPVFAAMCFAQARVHAAACTSAHSARAQCLACQNAPRDCPLATAVTPLGQLQCRPKASGR